MEYSKEEMIQNLLRAEKIDAWLEKRDFNTWESNLAPMQVSNKKLWEEIEKNPMMSEEEFLEIVRKLKGDDE